jgi:hypothetical protein
VVCLERILAMKLGFAIPIVGSAVGNVASLSAFCRGLERSAGSGADEAIMGAFAMFPNLDQLLDFASQIIAEWSDRGKA